MAVEIKKAWTKISDQVLSDGEGNKWAMAEVIDQSKELPVMDIPLDHLAIDKEICEVSIRDFVAHMKMVMDCKLEYPIILDENGTIFDGRHRVAKALFEEADTIKAVRFQENPLPFIKGE